MNSRAPRWGATDFRVIAFILGLAGSLLFAVYTRHAWEDYYITYRASKNLATGHGLVFNHGDRLQTFTSPLGVLLPALSYVLTARTSDDAALWIFRGMSCLAFGGAAALVAAAGQRRRYGLVPVGFMVLWLCTDAKSLDFTINGMETGFMLLFLSYCWWALLAPAVNRRWLHLGAAWAGLMWTRPDSFIYIGLLGLAAFLFRPAVAVGLSRRQLLVLYLQAGLLCTALYLPWFAGSWAYYGSPISHTIVAKSSAGTPRSALTLLQEMVQLPQAMWQGRATPEASFLPTYYAVGGWPTGLIVVARILGFVVASLWFLPFVRTEVRVASFAFLGAHAYLTVFPYFPFPWYLPPTLLLAVLALGGLLAQLLEWAGRQRRVIFFIFATVFTLPLVLQIGTALATSRQMAAEQSLIESGNRQRIGEWLATQAKPGDQVFLEPLGYIGFYSQLKTFDWPGLSSREVVAAHRRVGSSWAMLIEQLQPTWLVLRPFECRRIEAQIPELLGSVYRPVRTFDVLDRVKALDLPGRRLLEMDATFVVYHQENSDGFARGSSVEFEEVKAKYMDPTPTWVVMGRTLMRMIHAPGSAIVRIPPGARQAQIQYGFRREAWTEDPKTDGAVFEVRWVDGAKSVVLHRRDVRPTTREADRGALGITVDLPANGSSEARLLLVTEPGETEAKDWTCWALPEFR